VSNLLRKKLPVILLTCTLILSLTPTHLGREGRAVALTPNLNILVVRDGPYNYLLRLTEQIGFKIPGDRSTDRYIQNLNAYGLATHYLQGVSPDGLYLSQKEFSRKFDHRLKSGDVIKSIGFSPDCKPQYDGIQAAWVHTSQCASNFTIFRNERFINFSLSKKEGDDFKAIRVLSDRAPEPPKEFNQISGHSAGLILSLYYLDRSSKGSLFSSDVVSGSGMIEIGSRSFSPIADLGYKYLAAVRAKSTVLFLADGQSLEEIYTSNIALDSSMKIYRVKNLHEMVQILCQRGASDAICQQGAKR
jgi:hypothetical protein